jgi:hypothetical protein
MHAHKKTMERRRAFIAGTVSDYRLGGYGGTVTVRAESSGVLIKTTKPAHRQKFLTPNTRSVRETAAAAADQAFEKLRTLPSARAIRLDPFPSDSSSILTVGEIWVRYLEIIAGAVPPGEVLTWGRRQVTEHIAAMPQELRDDAATVDSIVAVLVAARRLHLAGVAPFESAIDKLQPGDFSRWRTSLLQNDQRKRSTPSTYQARFVTAVRSFQTQWPERWGERADPTGKLRAAKYKAKPPEIGEKRAELLLEGMRKLGSWRSTAAIRIAHESGRRVGSIAGARDGMHLSAPPLCESDFTTIGGRLYVNWRANSQKGDAYGRNDMLVAATRHLEVTYRWLRRFHRNPKGPDHPLIWSEADETRAQSYNRLRLDISAAWEAVFGEKKPLGLGMHSFCRTTITTLCNELGIVAAATYSGRSVKVIDEIYLQRRPEIALTGADALDGARASRRKDNNAKLRRRALVEARERSR